MKKQNNPGIILTLLRQKAEELLKSKPALSRTQLLDAANLKLLRELEVNQKELESQNEELMLSQAEAKQAAEKYAELYDSAPTGYFTLSPQGEITDLNFSGAAMLGKDRRNLKNSSLGFFITTETRIVYNQFLDNIFYTKTKQICEVTLLAEGHQPIPVLLTGIPDKNLEQCLLSVVDITERRQAEKALQESEQKYRHMLESSEIGVGVYSLDGKILYYNQKALRTLGGEADDYIGKTLHEIFGEAVASVFVERIQQSAQSEKSIEYEELVTLATGDRWFLSIYSRLTSPEGKVYGVQVIAHDISERKLSEEKLRASTEFANSLISSMQDGVSVLDTNGIHIDVNPAFCLITGFSREELLGTSPAHLYWPPEEYNNIEAAFQKTLTSGSGNFELIFMRKNGERFPVIVSPFAIKDKLGNTVSYSATVKDISERKQAEEMLKQSKIQLELAHQLAGAGTWRWDIASNNLTWSKELFDLFGLDPDKDKATFDAWTQLVHPDDRVVASERIELAISKKMPLNSEYRILHPDGQVYWISALGNTIYNNAGEPVQMSGICTDITERKQAQEALQQSEERYRSLITNLDAGIVVHAPDTAIIMNNRRASELLGLSEDQMKGKLAIDPGWKFIGENNIPFQLTEYPVNRIVATKKPLVNTILGVIRPAEKDLVWLSINGFPVFDAKGEIAEILISFIDITERKTAEEALRLKNLVFDASISAISISDLNGVLTEANDAFLRIWGFPARDEVLGRPIADYLQDAAEGNAIITALNETGEWEGDYTARRKDGTTFTAHGQATTIKDKNGKVIGYQSSVIDITERKLSERMLQQNNEELEKLNVEKDKFFSIIAHDLRSPFNSFLGLTKMIEEELSTFSPDELQSSISSMRKSAGIVFHLLENLLEWSRMQRGLHSFRPVPFKLSEQLITNIELVRLASEKKNIRIIQQIPDKLTITADPQMFQSLMSNLVFNAVKFTPNGGEVTIAAKKMPDHSVIISVSDNGIGMDIDTLNNLFSINRSNYRKGTEGEPSSGLGLVICKDFVDKHGGKIWVESKTGKGSTFYFSIPNILVKDNKKEISDMELQTEKIPLNAKLKILVAEDDETTQMFISLALKPLCREIIKAVTGVEAVNACSQHPDIDLILMDIKMPEMDGYEATRQIRMYNKKVVIIAQTAFITANDRKQAMAAGCNEFIPKPLDMKLLKGMIQKCFETY